MRVLLTGHRGYIGAVLGPMLLDEGFEVVGLDSDLYRACTFGDDGGLDEIPALEKDVRDVDEADLRGFDAVLHLAALSNDPLGNLDPDLTFEINHRASVRLARLAKAAGVSRFVFSSSCSNYGVGEEGYCTEESPTRPLTPYGLSKVAVERDVRPLADERFSPVFLRNATAYGVSPRMRFDLVVNNLVAWAFTTGQVRLKSDGSAWRPLVHIEDISRAFIAALRAPREAIHGEAFNIGRTSENYTVRDVALMVRDVVPGSRVSFAEGAEADLRNYRVSCEKAARTLTGFQPRWTVRMGVEQAYEAYCRLGLRLDEFEGDRFQRIAHVRRLLSDGALGTDLRWSPAAATRTGSLVRQ